MAANRALAKALGGRTGANSGRVLGLAERVIRQPLTGRNRLGCLGARTREAPEVGC